MSQQDLNHPREKKHADPPLSGGGFDNAQFYYPYIAESVQEGVWVIDVEGRTIYANPRMGELLGTSSEAIKQKTLYDFLIEDDDERALRRTWFDPRYNNKAFECRYRQANGHARALQVTPRHVEDPRGNPLGLRNS